MKFQFLPENFSRSENAPPFETRKIRHFEVERIFLENKKMLQLFFGVLLTPFRAGGILTLLAALVLFGMAKDQKAGTKVNEKKRGWRGAAFLCLAICAVQQNLMTAPSYFEDARAVTSIARSLATASGTFLGALVYNLLRMNAERLAQLRSNLGRWTL